MGRPTREYRTQENGKSLQVFKEGQLGGSISIKALYVLVSNPELKHTTMLNIQEYFLKDGQEIKDGQENGG